MTKLRDFRNNLKAGEVYRREDLEKLSKSVDRHLKELLEEAVLVKLSQGLYYMPKVSVFGKTPPDETALVTAFLKEKRFLLTSLNAYNSLGVGTTQLYNERMVYNHKRHEVVKLGNRTFNFKKRPDFPLKASQEFLLVDLVNNLDQLSEDQNDILERVKTKVVLMNRTQMKRSLTRFGNVKTKKLFMPLLNQIPIKSTKSICTTT
ncbi:MAG: hypothetical protein IPH42_16345 [Bacteroidetes bacterium]|nr:hypothetical protein [Bacteroidota bacterium]